MSEFDSASSYSEDDDEESESECEKVAAVKRKRKPFRKEFPCVHCKAVFPKLAMMKKHTKNCKKKNMLNKCMWCGMEFTNRGNLASHAFHMHGDSSYKTISKPKKTIYKCNACNMPCATMTCLRYHIRKMHFNLQAKIPHAELKKINQIWYEKVLNSDKIVEIKKVSHSTLILKTLDNTSGIRVKDVEQKVVDLTPLYPLGKYSRAICEYCKGSYLKRDLRKHIEEKHMNLKKFSCNNCQRTFKRSYQYLQHQCSRIKKTRGVRHAQGPHATPFKIASVEGFAVPL